MRVKEHLLARLEKERGRIISGAALAKDLGVSRSAVWKAVQALKNEGFLVETHAGAGYSIPEDADRLSDQGIKKYLVHKDFFSLNVFREIDSTNLRAKQMASSGAEEGCVVISEVQSAGRGRLGRKFYSPEGDGLYISVLLRPELPAAQALCLTTEAAVSVCEAIETNCGLRPGIKWVNDLLIDGKKVCGILTEAQINIENGQLDWAVVGIGVNVRMPEKGYPQDIRHIAGALYERDGAPPDIRCRLAAGILDAMYDKYFSPQNGCIEQYRRRSVVVGHDLWVLGGEKPRRAHALRIEDDFGLLVEYEDGTRQVLSSGEVSTRLAEENR